MKRTLLFLPVIIILIVGACKSKEEKELELIQEYLTKNNITTEPTASGLYYIETKAGDGLQAEAGDVVTVDYTGKFIDGEIFDSSIEYEPFSFTLGEGNVIKGWDEGIAYMKENGKATLIIPSSLGYGSYDYSSIPAYSTLIFDVELIDVQK
jgi:FKBP-type peptidyl-prolyl cis-trans isomerase